MFLLYVPSLKSVLSNHHLLSIWTSMGVFLISFIYLHCCVKSLSLHWNNFSFLFCLLNVGHTLFFLPVFLLGKCVCMYVFYQFLFLYCCLPGKHFVTSCKSSLFPCYLLSVHSVCSSSFFCLLIIHIILPISGFIH